MHALALIYAVSMPLLLGVILLRFLGLGWRADRIGFPAWSWLVGCVGLGVLLRLCREIGLPLQWWWSVPLVVAIVLELARRRRQSAVVVARDRPGFGFSAFVIAGALLCVWFALAGMDRPCIEGDEGNIWSLKAKSLLVDWGDGFAAAQVHNLHPDYPQLNPWLQAWVYVLTGTPDFVQFENRWLVQLCDVALFVAVAAAVRHRLRPLPAALLAALVLLEPEFQSLCRTAYADGMVALGLVVAVDGFLRWRDSGSRGHAWLAGIGIAFALWSKNETMLYLASAGIAAVLVRLWCAPLRSGWVGKNVVLLAPAAAVIANTVLWNRRFGMQSDLMGANPTGKSMFRLMAEQWPERIPALLNEAWQSMIALGHTHAVFGVLLLALVLVPRTAFGRELALPVLATLGAYVGMHVVYVGSFLPLRFHLDTSYLRVLFQLLPVVIVLLASLWRAVVVNADSRQTAGTS